MKKLHISVGLLSAALIAFQLVLMQILSIVQWYHFAYMVISVALLGFGASGTTIALARSLLVKYMDVLLPLLLMSSGVSMTSVVYVSQSGISRFDSYLLFVEEAQLLSLLLTYLLLFIPFFFGALALGLVFVRHVEEIGSVYFSNLLGSGLGGLIGLGLLWAVFPQEVPPLTGLLPILAGIIVLPLRRRGWLLLVAVCCVAACLFSFLWPPHLVLSEYKTLRRVMNLPDARIVLERCSPHGFVQVVSSRALRHAPGLSLTYRGDVPVREAVFSNGDLVGPIVSWSRHDSSHILDYTTLGLSYAVRTREFVFIPQSGTGMCVAQALVHGAKQVVATEPHSAVLSVLRHALPQATDSLLFHPAVTVYEVSPRTHVLRDTSHYDLIMVPMLDAFGGTVGLYALQEQYLLTREGFGDMWNRLRPDGVISVSSWMDNPVRNPLKALATLVEMLSEAGVNNVSDHIAAVRSWGTVTFIVKRTPLTVEETEKVREFSRRMQFDPVLLPGLESSEREKYNRLGDVNFLSHMDEIVLPGRVALYDKYDFNIRPATDDRPYFSQFLRWQSVLRLAETFGRQTFPFLELGYIIVILTLVQIGVVAVLLVVLPLFSIPKQTRGKCWTILYFGALGAGYMFVEMVLIQRFILFFGSPVFAAAAVISAMLLCSGVGSYCSKYLRSTSGTLARVAGVVTACLALYAVVLPALLQSTTAFPVEVKVVISLLLIAPPALVMGLPFPLGLKFLSERSEEQVPWAWGINGCLSVVSPALAMTVAVEAGFLAVQLCAAGMYALAAAVSVYRSGPSRQSPIGYELPDILR